MSSSIGRIALGVVGAVIGAPLGMPALGFALGSSIGGAIFAPSGPTVEGPRLGDTSVTASSLGETIPEQYGVTRTSGNMIWSGGLKEIKVTKETGGKGGGGESTQITYDYYASFALAIGKGQAKEIRKIWADGKLIYDGTTESGISDESSFGSAFDNNSSSAKNFIQGGGGSSGDKYNWVLRNGGDNQLVDGLIKESINRRLSGMPDVNRGNTGNGTQSEYATINDLITKAQTGSDGRSQFYAQKLQEVKNSAESAGDTIPDYGFTPAYRGIAFVRFRDMPLKDFGNRIPNITFEVVWESASANSGMSDNNDIAPTGVNLSTIGPAPTPEGLMAVDTQRGALIAHEGNTVRRFTSASLSEDMRVEIDPVGSRVRGRFLGEGERLPDDIDYGCEIDQLLAVGTSGTILATGTRNLPGIYGGIESSVAGSLISINPLTMQPIGGTDDSFFADWATALYIQGQYPRRQSRGIAGSEGWTGVSTVFGSEHTQTPVGDHFAYISGDTIGAVRLEDGFATSQISGTIPNRDGAFPSIAPLASGLGEKGAADVYVPRFSGTEIWIGKYSVKDDVILRGFFFGGTLSIQLSEESRTTNPFSSPIDYVSATIFERGGSDSVMIVVSLVGGGTGIVRYDEQLGVSWTTEIPEVVPPLPESGLSRSDTKNFTLVFASGKDLVVVDLGDGTHKVWEDILSVSASDKAQVYAARIAGFVVWVNDVPKIYRIGTVAGTSRDHDLATLLPDVVTNICLRSGVEPEEINVSGIPLLPVRGYSIARPSTGRKSLEPLMQAFFFEGSESDWAIKFSERSSSPVRTIHEDELGGVDGPTGDINWMESRVPEHDIPGQINLKYADPLRDYQSSSAHKRRISNPIPAMYSRNVQNVEMPIVMKDYEANAVAERLLFLSWMSRDSSKGVLGWTHADLDPNDVIEVEFRDGRKIQDRLGKTTLGANFEIEIETQRSGDPVFVASPQTTIPGSAIPSVSKPAPVPSKMFAVDMPLLYDYHETGRASARYYTAVGAESPRWSSASIFKSPDGSGYTNDREVDTDVTWGVLNNTLQPPRAIWSTDTENTLRVSLSNDRGDVSSVTREQIIAGANLALVYNKNTGIGEIIQFQTVSIDEDSNVYTLSNLVRGRRGTDYAVSSHGSGAIFILLNEAQFQVGEFELSRIGSDAYFKAVSTGTVISAAEEERILLRGLSLFPYAPSRVRRDFSAGDLTVSWNRRTRVGGGWDMFNNIETVPVSENFEAYELYLLPPTGTGLRDFDPDSVGSYLAKVETSNPSHTFTAAELSSYGISEDSDVNIAVFQISAQVGRGFPRTISLSP